MDEFAVDQIDDGMVGVQTFGVDDDDEERLDNMLIEDGMTLQAAMENCS